MRRIIWFWSVFVLGGGLVAGLRPSVAGPIPANPLAGIDHFVIMVLENRSFDSLFGRFPGANGLANAEAGPLQVDREGTPYSVLPPVFDAHTKMPDARFPTGLPNAPFDIGRFVPLGEKTGDLIHRFFTHQLQINGGRNDRFVAWSDAGALTMGHYDLSGTALWALAQEFTLADNFFQGAFGGSFLNHFWLACACVPRYEEAPDALRVRFDEHGALLSDAIVTADGYAINTMESQQPPRRSSGGNSALLLPPQSMPTLGDRLSEKGVTWAWYSGGWADALAGKAAPYFQYHHQPYAYFARYGDTTEARARHLKDVTEFERDIAAGTLPAVSFYKPLGPLTQHSGYADMLTGDRHIAELVSKIRQGSQWSRTAIIITYDENGGYWDHVAPPQGDRWGPGTRIPALIVSPLARKGFVDHTTYDSTSILTTISHRFDLPPLSERAAHAADLSPAFVEAPPH